MRPSARGLRRRGDDPRLRLRRQLRPLGGGGLYAFHAATVVEGCTFVGNTSIAWGGGFHAQYHGTAPVTLDGCTFSDNGAPQGGAIYLRNGALVTVTRSILAFSAAGAAAHVNDGESQLTLACCDVFGNAGGDWTGAISDQAQASDSFSQDPLFCDAASGWLGLRTDSPCASANNPACGQVGALGAGCGFTLTVAADGGCDHPTIQAAIDAAGLHDVVALADGVYTGAGNCDLDYGGKAITLRSQSGEPAAYVIDCQGSAGEYHRGVDFHTGGGPASVLENVTITGGHHGLSGAVQIDGA